MKYYNISVYYCDGETVSLRPVSFDNDPADQGSIKYTEIKHNVDHYLYISRIKDEKVHEEIVKFGVEVLHRSCLIYKVDEEQLALMILALT